MDKIRFTSPEPDAQDSREQVVLGMAISLDGFIAYRNSGVSRLYPDLDGLRRTESLKESIRTTGVVVTERRAYNMEDPNSYADGYEYRY